MNKTVGSVSALIALSATAASADIGGAGFSTVELPLTSGLSVSLDLDGDGTNDFDLHYSNSNGSIMGGLANETLLVDGTEYEARRLALGAPISLAATGSVTALWTSMIGQGASLVGVKFQSGGQTHLGWIQFNLPDSSLGWVVRGAWEREAGLGLPAGGGHGDVVPPVGPRLGGNLVVITNIAPVIGSGTDISNLVVAGAGGAVLFGQGSNWVSFTAPAAAATGAVDMVIQSGSMGDTLLAGAYAYADPGLAVLGTNGATLASGEAASPAKGTDFGSQPWGAATTRRFEITNAGSAALTLSGVTTSGAACFLCSGMPASIPPGVSSNATVTFVPGAVGEFAASLYLFNDSTTTPYIVNLAGVGAKRDQAIAFDPIADQVTTAIVALVASASSGLPVEFEVADGPGVITVLPNLRGAAWLSFTGPGVVRVTAAQAGDGQWNPAPPLTNAVPVQLPLPGPYVPGDFDGDGRTDLNVYLADPYWTAWYSLAVDGRVLAWEQAWGGDPEGRPMMPAIGDYDGDRLADLGMYDAANGCWYLRTVADAVLAWDVPWGGPGFVPVPGDYDGDGRWDMAVYHESAGAWYARSVAGATLLAGEAFGGPGFVPLSGDWDGDGTHDLGVCFHDTGHIPAWIYWYGRSSATGGPIGWGAPWGRAGWTAVDGDYNGDGATDRCAYDPETGAWYAVDASGTRVICWAEIWGGPGLAPVPGDYDGDRIGDLAVYEPSTGFWFVRTLAGTILVWETRFGGPGYLPYISGSAR